MANLAMSLNRIPLHTARNSGAWKSEGALLSSEQTTLLSLGHRKKKGLRITLYLTEFALFHFSHHDRREISREKKKAHFSALQILVTLAR